MWKPTRGRAGSLLYIVFSSLSSPSPLISPPFFLFAASLIVHVPFSFLIGVSRYSRTGAAILLLVNAVSSCYIHRRSHSFYPSHRRTDPVSFSNRKLTRISVDSCWEGELDVVICPPSRSIREANWSLYLSVVHGQVRSIVVFHIFKNGTKGLEEISAYVVALVFDSSRTLTICFLSNRGNTAHRISPCSHAAHRHCRYLALYVGFVVVLVSGNES